VLLFTGKPGKRAVFVTEATTGNSTPAAGKGKALGFAAPALCLLATHASGAQLKAFCRGTALPRKGCDEILRRDRGLISKRLLVRGNGPSNRSRRSCLLRCNPARGEARHGFVRGASGNNQDTKKNFTGYPDCASLHRNTNHHWLLWGALRLASCGIIADPPSLDNARRQRLTNCGRIGLHRLGHHAINAVFSWRYPAR